MATHMATAVGGEIDADIEADERFVAEMKAKAGPSKLQEKIAALHGKDDPLPPG
jgi:hypothetical protein